MPHHQVPKLIALDWGTSSLRAYLLGEKATVLESRSKPLGILHIPNNQFQNAFESITGDWRSRWPFLPAIASGMIGSRQGWQEVPYIESPADISSIAKHLASVETPSGRLYIVPGVLQNTALPNVLRGEETQVFGALFSQPELSANCVVILPGTHSKWVTLSDNKLQSFSTYMTGELFALLRNHSILGKPAAETIPQENTEAFLKGARVARESGSESISPKLFTARSLYLTGDLPAAHCLEYLSGLLIGEEIRSAFTTLKPSNDLNAVLIGNAPLCKRYQTILQEFGATSCFVLPDSAAVGLWKISIEAGIIA